MAIPLTRIQIRRGDSVEWTADRDVVLGRGEPAAEFYTADSAVNGPLAGALKGQKIGDGVSKYWQLPYLLPDRGVQHNNRPMRDLSGFGTIQNQTAGQNFGSLLEAMEKILFPYEPPSFNFSGSGETTLEVGRTQQVDLLMNNIRSGSFPLVEKSMWNRTTGLKITQSLPAVGQSTVPNTDLSYSSHPVTLNTHGTVLLQGQVTNARDTAEGPHRITRDKEYYFRYPIIKGLAGALPAGYNASLANGGLTAAQWTTYFATNVFSRNLRDAGGQEVRGAVANTYAIIAVPYIYQGGFYNSITQNGDPIPSASVASIFATHLTNLDSRATSSGTNQGALGGDWTNIQYRIMIQRAPAGNGSFEYIWIFS